MQNIDKNCCYFVLIVSGNWWSRSMKEFIAGHDSGKIRKLGDDGDESLYVMKVI